MDAGKIKWCLCQKKGLKVDKPNQNLADEYIKSSEETLSILNDIKDKSNMWLATTKYYSEYFAVYALLQRIGIKCEIHECTIEVCKLLEQQNIIPKGYAKILEDDKELRIDNQYYLKNRHVDLKVSELRNFVLTLKNKITTITYDEIELIKKEISKLN
jgi:uncharacterized protein (UPF0332 family)